MCGIIGYLGDKEAQEILLGGLKRMEYRGYDSAGVATKSDDGDVTRLREAGKVANLAAAIDARSTNDTIGIGHTRWATHGAPTENNAHPHTQGRITVVHNGIIENYLDLKERLIESGYEFVTETDTEAVAALIDSYYKEDLKEAVEKALADVRGTYGLAVIAEDNNRVIVAARKGSPVIIGQNDTGIYLASDAAALAGHVQDIMHLDDDEMAVITDGQVDVYDVSGVLRKKEAEVLDMLPQSLEMGGYDHFLIKEIMEQPETSRTTLRGHLLREEGAAHLGGIALSDEEIRELTRIMIIGCGTAYYAGLLGKYMVEKFANIPVDVEIASEFRYRDPAVQSNMAGLVISQSGETADTLAALREAKRKGVYLHGLVNSVGSTIAREVDGGMYLHVGPEVSVASTKAFTSQVLGVVIFGLHIARKRGMGLREGQEIIDALDILPSQIENTLQISEKMEALAKELVGFDNALFLGRDNLYPIALEGSLKLKEISYIHAEAYPAGEMKHGPIALIDENFLVIFLLQKGELYEKSLTNLEEVKARGGKIVVITDEEKYLRRDPEAILIETGAELTAPLIFNIPLQLLAYYIAKERGLDVDKPRNLAKSVTVE